jgi:copper chaperone CopZ
MKQTFLVSGMTCEACKYKVEHLLKSVEGVQAVNANFQSGEIEIQSKQTIELNQLQSALSHTGKYFITHLNTSRPAQVSFVKTYRPLFTVFGYVVLVSLVAAFSVGQHFWMNFARYFMAGFFIAFSFFKILDVRAFASAFSMYDVVAKRFYIYGWLYPFIELALGIALIMNLNPVLIHSVTLTVMLIGTIGVAESVMKKRKIPCACLGTVFNLPMSFLTIVENGTMIAMSILMLIFN